MAGTLSSERIASAGISVVLYAIIGIGHAHAQIRGVYPLGMSATNSGLTPAPGFTYSNQLLSYSRSELKDPGGQVIATGSNSVIMDMNTLAWVSKKEILGGAKYSASATIPFANNSLTSDVSGRISGGGGLADSFYQPFILGWDNNRVAIRTTYGFLAPTGSFDSEASDNVGSGYWTQTVSSGQTFYLTESKATSVSAFQLYEFHSKQKETDIHPGQNLNLDYSLVHAIKLKGQSRLQAGLAGYHQWQTTDKSGPAITPTQAAAHYRVNAMGFTLNVTVPSHQVGLGFKYFNEFSNRSTHEGYSVQMSGSIHF